MKFKGVLFDKDGTLFDFANTWEAWAEAFLLRMCSEDRPRATQIGAQIGFDLNRRKFSPDSIVIAGTPDEVTAVLAPHFPEYDPQTLLEILNEEAANAPQQEVVPLVPFLQSLAARGLKLGVATNDAEVPARAHLGSVGATELFDFIVGFDSGYGGKPAPGQLLGFAEKMNLAPEQVVMVGDSTHDLAAGRAAGMATVAVLTGLAGHDTLAPLADVVLPDIGALPGWLENPANH